MRSGILVMLYVSIASNATPLVQGSDTLRMLSNYGEGVLLSANPMRVSSGDTANHATNVKGIPCGSSSEVTFSFLPSACMVGNGCCLPALISSQPCRPSNPPFASFNFAEPLDTEDLAEFGSRADTTRFDNQCYLPMSHTQRSYFALVSTAHAPQSGLPSRTFAVLKFDTLWKDPGFGTWNTQACYNTIAVTWYWQPDGSLDFSGIAQTTVANPGLRALRGATQLNVVGPTAMFDLHGRRIDLSTGQNSARLPAGVYAMRIAANCVGGTRGFVVVAR